MPVNLTVMDVVGRPEAAIFTWNPVEQMWVQERGGAAKPPPAPHDIHAIQTWFFDPDAKEWIQTVLGPMGRQLAAQWRGAHRVPEAAIVRKTKPQQRRSPLPILLGAVVIIVVVGGAALAAPGFLTPQESSAPSARPIVNVPPGATNAPATPAPAEPTPTAAPAEPTAVPTSAPVATPRPATPRPATPRPATPRPVTPAPDFVSPSAAVAGTTFRFTFVGLPPASTYRTTYTRGSVVTGYATGEVPLNGTVNLDLRTNKGSFAPDTYFLTIRAGDVVKTVSFRITG